MMSVVLVGLSLGAWRLADIAVSLRLMLSAARAPVRHGPPSYLGDPRTRCTRTDAQGSVLPLPADWPLRQQVSEPEEGAQHPATGRHPEAASLLPLPATGPLRQQVSKPESAGRIGWGGGSGGGNSAGSGRPAAAERRRLPRAPSSSADGATRCLLRGARGRQPRLAASGESTARGARPVGRADGRRVEGSSVPAHGDEGTLTRHRRQPARNVAVPACVRLGAARQPHRASVQTPCGVQTEQQEPRGWPLLREARARPAAQVAKPRSAHRAGEAERRLSSRPLAAGPGLAGAAGRGDAQPRL